MVILIAGASHTGKTVLARKLMEKYRFPYLSIDHLKMGLIRSGSTNLTPEDDEKLTGYLWPIVREIVKTVIENRQCLIVEGIYIPFDWEESFEDKYLSEIRYVCLIMTRPYIENHFDDIKRFACAAENRFDDDGLSKTELIKDNLENLANCRKYGLRYILIDKSYNVEFEF